MHKILTAATVLAIAGFSACNNNAKKPGDVVIKSEDGKTEMTVNPSAMQAAADDFTKQSEALAKLTPYTSDQMLALIPAQFGGSAKTSHEANSTMGVSMVEAKYKINDTADYKLVLMDCAGAAGSGMYAMQFLSLMNTQKESEEEMAGTIDWNGSRGYQEYNKLNHDSKLTWVAGNRILVMVEGNKVPLDVLKSSAKNLVLPIK